MKLSVSGVTLAAAIIWGLTVLLVGLANLAWPPYGEAFLNLIDSLYPGYHHQTPVTLGTVLVGTGYAILDGAVGGLFFAVIYNLCGCCRKKSEGAG